MENNRFEDSFRNAFDGAEVSPTDVVWKNIELDLEKASGGNLKRNLLLFQLLAAASVAFAFGVTAVYYLDQPAVQDDFTKETLNAQSIVSSPDSSKESTDQKTTSDESIKKNVKSETVLQNIRSSKNGNQENSIAIQSINDQPEKSTREFKITRKDLSSFTQTKKPILILPKEEEPVEPDAGMVLLARLKDQEKKYEDEEKKTAGSNEKIWASVGVGAGSYNSNMQSSAANLRLDGVNNNASASASSQSSMGASYSVGVSVAGKISNRFIVQGGVSYLTQNADFRSTVSDNGTASLSEFASPANFDSFQGVNPYLVNSSMQFVSIPVQAGYLVIDRAFGVQLNGGIATDLFLSNTLSSENDTYQKVTQTAGKDSPYRTVNFSGLLGTEVSYRIADHYRISLNPGLRYSLHSIYKEEVAAEITPVTFDVSLRFRYIFK